VIEINLAKKRQAKKLVSCVRYLHMHALELVLLFLVIIVSILFVITSF